MIVHIEYENLKKYKEIFITLSKKYGTKLSGVCLHCDKKVSLKPYEFSRKKMGQICYQIPLRLLNKKLIKYCNRLQIDLILSVESALTKNQKTLLKTIERATIAYNQSQDADTASFLSEQTNLLICSSEKNCALQADLFHLAVYNQHQYQCKCTSCLSNVLYITKENDVCFCPFHPTESKLCTIDCERDYFDNELFEQVLTKEIEKREECKKTCTHYSVCHGGCAMEDICQTVKTQYTAMQERASEIACNHTPLGELLLYEKEAVLRGVSQGK